MTRRISLVAVCCSRASVSDAFFARSAVSSRAFSMAMAAWSAKVSISAIWLSVNGRTSSRRMRITPSSSSALSIGIASRVRKGELPTAEKVNSGSDRTS